MAKHTLKILRREQRMIGHFTTLCMKGLIELRVNGKQLIILKTFLEYLEFYIVAY